MLLHPPRSLGTATGWGMAEQLWAVGSRAPRGLGLLQLLCCLARAFPAPHSLPVFSSLPSVTVPCYNLSGSPAAHLCLHCTRPPFQFYGHVDCETKLQYLKCICISLHEFDYILFKAEVNLCPSYEGIISPREIPIDCIFLSEVLQPWPPPDFS